MRERYVDPYMVWAEDARARLRVELREGSFAPENAQRIVLGFVDGASLRASSAEKEPFYLRGYSLGRAHYEFFSERVRAAPPALAGFRHGVRTTFSAAEATGDRDKISGAILSGLCRIQVGLAHNLTEAD